MKMEPVSNVESTTNLLTDNAPHSIKILNVKFGVKEKFVNVATTPTNIIWITTTFAQKRMLTALRSTCRTANVQNVKKDIH